MSLNIKPTMLDAGLVFSGKASGTMIHGFESPTEYTPTINSNYDLNVSAARDVVVWMLMNTPEPLYLFGPTGCGKSSLIRQLAARLNYPVFEVNGHERAELSDWIGHLTVENGNMKFIDGPLTQALRYGGLFLLNEIDLCSPSVLAGLNTLLDGSPLCLEQNGGELVMPAESFRFVATANTNGAGDTSGLYQGAMRQNLAFLDRFLVVQCDYPSPDVELNLLRQCYPALPVKVARGMVDMATEVRRLFTGKLNASDPIDAPTVEVTFSTRTLLRWADLTMRFKPLAQQGLSPIVYALDRALGFRCAPETQVTLHELAQRIFTVVEPLEDATPSEPSNPKGE